MNVTVTKPIKVGSTGEHFLPGQVIDLPEVKVREWEAQGLIRVLPSPGETAKRTKPESFDSVEKPCPFSLRTVLEGMLAEGPVPYHKIKEKIETLAWTEDDLRDAIRGWSELAAFDDGGTWIWEIRPYFSLRGSPQKIPEKKGPKRPGKLFKERPLE